MIFTDWSKSVETNKGLAKLFKQCHFYSKYLSVLKAGICKKEFLVMINMRVSQNLVSFSLHIKQ